MKSILFKSDNLSLAACFFFLLSVIFLGLSTATADDDKDLSERYRRIDSEFHETLHSLEDEISDLVEDWIELRDVRERMLELSMKLGSSERREAERELNRLERGWEREWPRFRDRLERALRPFERRYERLQDELWDRQEDMDPSDQDAFRRQQEEVQDLREEASAAVEKVDAIRELRISLNEMEMPTSYERLRIPGGRREAPRNYRFLNSNAPRMVDARWDLLDAMADAKRLLEEKDEAGNSWSPRQQRALESALGAVERAWDALQGQYEREARDPQRAKSNLQRDIDRVKDRLEGRSSGRMYDRLQNELKELEEKMEGVEENLERYRAAFHIPREFRDVDEIAERIDN